MTSFELSELHAKLDVVIGLLSRIAAELAGTAEDVGKNNYDLSQLPQRGLSLQQIEAARRRIAGMTDEQVISLAEKFAEPIDWPVVDGKIQKVSPQSLKARPFAGMLRAVARPNLTRSQKNGHA